MRLPRVNGALLGQSSSSCRSYCLWGAALTLALLMVLPTAAAPEAGIDEGAIMRALRVARHGADRGSTLQSWLPSNPETHCTWEGVKCNDRQEVLSILLHSWDSTHDHELPSATPEGSLLLPELAQLPRLEHLEVSQGWPILGSIPAEWGQPGAFPALTWLSIAATSLQGTLPDISPGALPLLEALELDVPQMTSHLPDNWASAATLPMLRQLRLVLNTTGGRLPSGWATGMPSLEWLGLTHSGDPLQEGLPAAWVEPGAFPHLKWLGLQLSVSRNSTEPLLPDIPPGALPALELLELKLTGVPAELPASWGDPRVLPALHELALAVRLLPGSQLPAEWARGFRRLTGLGLYNSEPTPGLWEPLAPQHGPGGELWQVSKIGSMPFSSSSTSDAAASSGSSRSSKGGSHAGSPGSPAAAITAATLPPEWAAPSAFPKLESLSITDLGLSGTFPQQWQHGGFPSLTHLYLPYNQLSGSLPADLFKHHPRLIQLMVVGNRFQGSLPDAWAASQVLELQLADNALEGTAFPPAWLEPGALPRLSGLNIAGNPGLRGTLPALLPWAAIHNLNVSATAITGCIPDTWCNTQFVETLTVLSIEGTAISPQLPSCLATYQIDGKIFIWYRLAAGNPEESSPARHRGASVAPWAMLLVLAAMVAAGAASRALWRRKLQRSRQTLQHLETVSLLQTRVVDAGSRSGSSGMAEVLGPGRKAQLHALLRSHLGSRDRSANVAVLPPSELQTVLAHRLLPGGAGVVNGAALQLRSLRPASDGTNSADGSRSSLGSQHEPLPDPNGTAKGSSGAEPLSRQWGLETDSLRVPPGQLEFVVDGEGRLVEIGEGAHAVVYLARLHGKMVAVKLFELEAGADSATLVWREVSLLRQCCHPRIVTLLGVAVKGHLLVVAMELMCGGSLRAVLQDPHRRRQLRWSERGRQLALDVAAALDFLHSHLNLMHSDIKSGNVLLSADLRGHLSDLGVAQKLTGGARSMLGCSTVYAAPEQLLGERCTLAADLYAVGVLLAELTTLTPAMKRGEWRLPHAPEECPQAVADLIQECVLLEPWKRPTAAQLLQRLQEAGP